MSDQCKVCAGEQGPDHRHVCAFCAGDADQGGSTSTAIYYGSDDEEKRFYCDSYCASAGEAIRSGEPQDPNSLGGLIVAARALKAQITEAGGDWRKV